MKPTRLKRRRAGAAACGNSASAPPLRARRRFVLGVVAALLLLTTVAADLPSKWCRLAAEWSLEANRPDRALVWIERSRWLRSDHPESDLLEARAWLWLNQTSLSLERLTRVSRSNLFPERVEAIRDLAYARRGQWDAAQRLIQDDVFPIAPRDVLAAVMRSAIMTEQYSVALQVAEQWTERYPRDPAVLYLKGLLSESRDDHPRAMAYYESALDRQPGLVIAAFRLGAVQRLVRDFEEAASSFLRCGGTRYDTLGRIEAANCLWQQERFEEAWNLLADPLDQPLAALLDLYVEVDEYVEDDRPALEAARIQSILGNPEQAVTFWRRVLQFNPRNFEARSSLADHLAVLGRTREAAVERQRIQEILDARRRGAEIRNELARDPHNLQLHCELAEKYLESESLAAALVELQAILRKDPDCKEAHRLMAEAYREKARTASDFEELALRHERLAR